MNRDADRTNFWLRAWLVLVATGMSGCVAARPAPTTTAAVRDGHQDCTSWILKHGQIWCVVPLTAEQASRVGASVRLVFKDGKVVRGEHRNGAGGNRTDDTGDAGFNVEHDAKGFTLRWFDRWGSPTTITRYEGALIKRLTRWGSPRRDSQEDGYLRRITALDANGFVVGSKIVDEGGRPALMNGVHETRVVLDAQGRTLERSFFDAAGAPMVDQMGVHKVRERPGRLGCVEQWEYFDAAGRPFGGAQIVSRGVRRCDAHGNMLSMRWYDPSGSLALNRQGIHGWDDTLDEHGQRVLHVTVGLDGKPAPVNGRESILREHRNAYGHVIRVDFLGVNREPVVLPEGHSSTRAELLENGAVVRHTFLDASGAPVVVKDGHAGWTADYDPTGQLLATHYLDDKGRPGAGRDGQAAVVYRYDERGLLKSAQFRDAADRPMTTQTGYAEILYERDGEGRIVKQRHLDAAGKPAQVIAGRAIWFSYIGAETRRPSAIPRDEAKRRAEEALRQLLARTPWVSVAKRFGETWDEQPMFGSPSYWYEPLWEALSKAKPGDPPVLLDTPRGFVILEAKE